MKFQTGVSGNVKGRPAGSKDKVKKDIKESFQSLVESNLSNINTWLNAVAADNPAKALDLMLKLSEFILPKMRATELKAEVVDSNQNRELEIAIERISYRTEEEIKQSNQWLKDITEKILAQERDHGSFPQSMELRK